MNKHRRKSSQRQFMQTMIISGVLGLAAMMLVMIYMIKLFDKKKAVVIPENIRSNVGSDYGHEVETEEIQGVIHEIGPKRKNIKIWDIDGKQFSKVYIKEKAQIKDAYGKPMSIQEVELGDIVEIIYETNKKEVLSMKKSAKAWRRSNISNIDINTSSKIIKIENSQYEYTNDIIILNDNFERGNVNDINNLDTLEIKGIDDTIWSIQVIQAAGYLKLVNIPTTNGTIEIGNNKIYRLAEIDGNIPLVGGKHKIVVHMEGYKPFAKHLVISTNQIEELDLKLVEESLSNLRVKVTNMDEDYKVQINDKTYKKDEAISLKTGIYTLKIIADGFKTAVMDIKLEDGDRKINVALQAEKEEKTPEAEQKPVINSPNINSPNNQGISKPPASKSETSKPEEEVPTEEIKTVQIIIETDPADAKVFVGGVYKGTTPALTGIKPGEYSITIEKDGYSPLYSTIIIDASNAHKGFLYTLQKEE